MAEIQLRDKNILTTLINFFDHNRGLLQALQY